jgi:hypothetical protein
VSVHRRFLSELLGVGLVSVAWVRAVLCRKFEVTEILHVQGSFSNYAGQCVNHQVSGGLMNFLEDFWKKNCPQVNVESLGPAAKVSSGYFLRGCVCIWWV